MIIVYDDVSYVTVMIYLIAFSELEVEGSFQLREDGAIFCLMG